MDVFINKSLNITAFQCFQVGKLKISEYFMKIKLKRGISLYIYKLFREFVWDSILKFSMTRHYLASVCPQAALGRESLATNVAMKWPVFKPLNL